MGKWGWRKVGKESGGDWAATRDSSELIPLGPNLHAREQMGGGRRGQSNAGGWSCVQFLLVPQHAPR